MNKVEQRIRELEQEGLSRSDAQAVVEAIEHVKGLEITEHGRKQVERLRREGNG